MITKILLLLFNGAKLSKLFATSGTMLISVFAYSLIFGWKYAAGFVLLIFFHEMGHFLAAKQRGLNVGAPMFIPFVGAWINLKDQPMNVETEAYIAMAGPVIGTIAAVVCLILAQKYDSTLLLALAYAGFFINLFNLIPISPLDGGRITAILSPKIWLIGAPILATLFLWRPSPLLILVAIMAAPQLIKAWRHRSGDQNSVYYQTTMEKRIQYAICYLGLTAFLAIMSHHVYQQLETTTI